MLTATFNKNILGLFVIKNEQKNKKTLLDFKKYIIKTWLNEVENVSENIDNILYKKVKND